MKREEYYEEGIDFSPSWNASESCRSKDKASGWQENIKDIFKLSKVGFKFFTDIFYRLWQKKTLKENGQKIMWM